MEDDGSPPPPKSGSRLERVLLAKRFAVTTEVVPPASPDPAPILASARRLRGNADAFNVTDSPRARVHMASWAGAALLVREGLEPVMQVVTRDRNRIALQADVLGACALGVRNLMALGGDDPKAGNEPGAAGVFDLDTEAFIETLRGLRDNGVLHGGDPVEPRPPLFIGATANPFGGSIEDSFVNLRRKAEAGADFVQTQAIFDLDGFEEWMHLVRKEWIHEKLHILVGVVPLKSAKAARFLNGVPGIVVPPEVTKRIERASNPKTEGIAIAVEAVNVLRKIEGVHGVHLMAVNWEEAVPAIVNQAGLLPRPDV
ncbi:MAG TPA: methylenetetrahydrofolate reductase [Thermoplasmata archaeon]|nr:methylenetetrahydrofolate reductase [Thermoplasmata archaeon]